ncbi:VanZ family protein [Desulfonatronum parangueonense]
MRLPHITLLLLSAGLPLFFISSVHDASSPLSQVNSLVHFTFFALLAWSLSRLRILSTYSFAQLAGLILAVATILGGGIELIQPYFNRTASWRDLGVNLLGACFALLFLAPQRYRLGRYLLRAAQVAVLAICLIQFYKPMTNLWDMKLAARQFPMLSDFETPFEARRWSRGVIDSGFAGHGASSLRVRLGTQYYSGTTMIRSFGDWQGYAALAMRIHNPGPGPLRMTISIRDKEHLRRGGGYHDRYNREFRLAKGWNDLSIPLENIENAPAGRRLDLSQVTSLAVFAIQMKEPRVIHLDHVRLIP